MHCHRVRKAASQQRGPVSGQTNSPYVFSLTYYTSDSTQVCVLCAPIVILEELAEVHRDSDVLDTSLELPFRVIHESWTACNVGQLALEQMEDQLVLLVVHRPRALVFHYLESGERGSLLLGPIHPYSTLVRTHFEGLRTPEEIKLLL